MKYFEIMTLNQKYGSQLAEQVSLDSSVITYDELRYLQVVHYGFDGCYHLGELIVNECVAEEVLEIFKKLCILRFPIEKMRVISFYDGDDEASMEDNNTSAFNFRPMVGKQKLSKHALGLAIDFNPKINPYIKGDVVLPQNGLKYLNRNQYPQGIIKQGDAIYRIFKDAGWEWGGDWTSLKDYQHFEKCLDN